MASYVLTAVGSDRPGLTQALAAAILSAGGNWLESHLSRLGGLYVGSVLVDLPVGTVEGLRAAVLAVDAHGLEVRIVAAIDSAGSESASADETFDFGLVGQDRPGIVREVTAVLAGLDANIETFRSWIDAEAYSGVPLFHMHARLRLPSGLSARAVQSALEAISAEVMVDLLLSPPDSPGVSQSPAPARM